MKKLIILFILIPIINFSQTLKGNVIDSISKEKLVLANITYLRNNSGTNTNLQGEYTLNIKEHLNDSIKISYIGYKSKYISLKNFNENKEYLLNFNLIQDENQLNEVIVTQKTIKYKKKYKLSEKRDGDISMFSLIGHETTCLIENPKNEVGRIKSVKLYVRKNKNADFIAKFRIKIYSYDKVNNKPSENLLAEDLIISPKNKTYQYVIDLENKKIPFLEDGVCVGIELVDENNTSKNGDKIGPGFRFTYGENKQLTWYNYRDKGWAKNDLLNKKSNSMSNLMVSMTVLMEN
ncbi:carboxypeptidase-like regulatory domain-containing protein [Flavobacterium gelidilacus]|jgi:hypothetical protein|uniref:carboxypeptidase-like regulatory domain-containing protein n=1 Tax=Flavobacterium gelidilacus TaxID=206041 RepID=UPI00047928C4|nr:carboxypeptidase-like regulatory domain-containing protein [Flavobacterium gelidilacus]